MEVSANVRTVMAKAGSFSTEYRVRELRLIAGEDNSVTRHKEHGCSYELDVRTVFFSPRLGHERLRVASQVQSNEVVVDMFAGVGCYSILTAKRQPACIVHAIDVNPEAYKFLVSNVLSNRVLANVKATMGDARAIIRAKLSGIADRVIMNLPGQAADFLGDACLALKERGGIIHFYSFDSADAPLDETSEKLKGRIRASGRRVKSILAARVVKAVAPYRVQTAIDALIV
jgi:tRNA (guanine37-N1)-methyltransferase